MSANNRAVEHQVFAVPVGCQRRKHSFPFVTMAPTAEAAIQAGHLAVRRGAQSACSGNVRQTGGVGQLAGVIQRCHTATISADVYRSQRIAAARRLSELFWKPASQKSLLATGLEDPLVKSMSTTPRLQAAPDDGEHTGR